MPPAAVANPASAVDEGKVVTAITDVASLRRFEAERFSLGEVLAWGVSPHGAGPDGPISNAELAAQLPAYDALAKTISDDLGESIHGVTAPLVTDHHDAAAFPAGNVGRAFDVRWLRSPKARFELAGIVNRLDRRDFSGGMNCGEIRLLYRLAYRDVRGDGSWTGSRMPFMVNVVLEVPTSPNDPGRCRDLAAGWAKSMPYDRWDLAYNLIPGPGVVAPPSQLKQVEINVQTVRFPSGVATEFAGQALYLLRQYTFSEEGTVQRKLLENTPDVARISADAGLRSRLVTWMGGGLRAIDRGVYELPDEFLAVKAESFSTLGSNRTENKPFDQIFPLGSRAELPVVPTDLSYVSTTDGLVERLNNGTCQGCHQAQSTAGFHFLGEDDPTETGVTNRLENAFSPHFRREQARRRAYGAAVAGGSVPEAFRPHSITPNLSADGSASAGAPCFPTGEDAFKERWACRDGLTCEVLAKEPNAGVNVGQCVVSDVAQLKAGMACRAGIIADGGSWWSGKFPGHQTFDLPEEKQFSSDAYNCRPTVIGVPLGRTYRSCTSAERALTNVIDDPATGRPADEVCAVVGGSKFDACVAADFRSCLDDIVGRGMVDTCSADRDCREDYICQAFPYELPNVPTDAARALSDAGLGFCTPTYFLFQMRLDGHPSPT